MDSRITPSEDKPDFSTIETEEKELTPVRFAKIYLSMLWRSTLVGAIAGMFIGILLISLYIEPKDLDQIPVLIFTCLFITLIRWFVTYHVFSQVIWSDFRIGMVNQGSKPKQVTAYITFLITICIIVLTVLVSLLMFFGGNLAAEAFAIPVESIREVVSLCNSFLVIYMEYLVLRGFIRYDLNAGDNIVLYGPVSSKPTS